MDFTFTVPLSTGKCFKPVCTTGSCQEFVTEVENLKDGKKTLFNLFPPN